jgi:hypothetical protein
VNNPLKHYSQSVFTLKRSGFGDAGAIRKPATPGNGRRPDSAGNDEED